MALILILFVAFAFGASQGATTAREQIGSHYRSKKAEKNKGAEMTGLSTAALMSTTAHSLGLAGRGFAKGWRRGWPKGREWVEDRINARRQPDPVPAPRPETAPETTTAAKPAVVADLTKSAARRDTDLVCITCGEPAVQAKPTSRGDSTEEAMAGMFSHTDGSALCPATALGLRVGRAVRPDYIPGQSAPTRPGLAQVHDLTSFKKATPAATTTAPGGVITMPLTTTTAEAHNHSALLAALDAIENEAAANIDDASADLARSNQEVTNIESLASGLADKGLDSESLGKIQQLIEPHQQRAEAAQSRLTASEALGALASQARQTIVAKHQAMKEAHDATPEAAQKAYYEGD